MGLHKYAFKGKKQSGKAQAHDVDASFKDFSQVCLAIKRKPVTKARVILDECISMKKAIPYHKFAKGTGHRSELGGRRGKYPIKEAKLTLKLLNNAVANAVNQGLDEEKLVVAHALANKQVTYKRYRRTWVGSHTLGYGRFAMWGNYVTCMVQIVVEESDKIKPDKEKKTESKAKQRPRKRTEAQTKKQETKPVEVKTEELKKEEVKQEEEKSTEAREKVHAEKEEKKKNEIMVVG
ncbi:MAG: 50S ribosomal protein L22 [Candidatus Micrarchaeota archaeon]